MTQPDPALQNKDDLFVEFIIACEQKIDELGDTIAARDAIAMLAATLVRSWNMPDAQFRQLQAGAPYSSYQLYLNKQETLSVILDIFAPGQVAPVHNHCTWGVFVCLEGEELERRYTTSVDLSTAPVETEILNSTPGMVSVAGPARNAFHQVECVGDVPAISLHIYGANLKALDRDRWDKDNECFVTFCSGSDPRRRQSQHYLTPEGLAKAAQESGKNC